MNNKKNKIEIITTQLVTNSFEDYHLSIKNNVLIPLVPGEKREEQVKFNLNTLYFPYKNEKEYRKRNKKYVDYSEDLKVMDFSLVFKNLYKDYIEQTNK